jgi:hypothetical protein
MSRPSLRSLGAIWSPLDSFSRDIRFLEVVNLIATGMGRDRLWGPRDQGSKVLGEFPIKYRHTTIPA